VWWELHEKYEKELDKHTPVSDDEEEEPAKKKKKTVEKTNEKDESDLARAEKERWNEWNAGDKGGYTEQFLNRYKNCTSWESKPKKDKRLKGSVGPGNGNEYIACRRTSLMSIEQSNV